MRRIRTEHRQRLLFQPLLEIPRWEQLTSDEKKKVISRLAIMLRRHRAVSIRAEKEVVDE
jgi:predicted Fe-S protein YdhL (DUF1289 family)